MLYFLDLFGVCVFAVSGALAAGERRMDLFGVVVLALVTALGGGTVRDLVIDAAPVLWVRDPSYIVVAVVAALITFAVAHLRPVEHAVLALADAAGLAVFTVVGAETALRHVDSPLIAVMMGVMTGVAGGIIRDILANRVPMIFRREIYATAALCGAIAWVLLRGSAVPPDLGMVLAGLLTFALRVIAWRWELSLPAFPVRGGTKAKKR